MWLFKSDCKIISDFLSIVISASNFCDLVKAEKEKTIIIKSGFK